MPEGRISVYLGCPEPDNCAALLSFLPDETRPAFAEDCSTPLLQNAFDELELIEPPESIRRFQKHGFILEYDGLEIEEHAESEDKTVREYLQALFVQLNKVGVDELMVEFSSIDGGIMYECYHLDKEPDLVDCYESEEAIEQAYGSLPSQEYFDKTIKKFSKILDK